MMKAIWPAMEKRNHFIPMPPRVTIADRGGTHLVAAEVPVIVRAANEFRHMAKTGEAF